MNIIPIAIGLIGIVLVLTNIEKIRGLIPNGNGNGNGNGDTTVIKGDEGDTTIVNLPPQNGTKQETERVIVIVTTPEGKQVTSPIVGKTAETLFKESKFIDTKTEQEFEPDLDFQQTQIARETLEQSIDPKLKFATSLAGSDLVFGRQIKRDPSFEGSQITDFKITDASSTFQQTLKREQERAAKLAAQLFGSIQNPLFATGGQ